MRRRRRNHRAAILRRRVPPVDLTFITTWQTTTAAESITLPLISSGTYDFEVDWGDGTTDTITAHTDAARIHEYADAGTRDVRISGVCEGWNFFDVVASKDKILDVKNWGSLRLGSSSVRAFRECGNLDVTATDTLDLTGATSLNGMFFITTSLVGSESFNKWGTGNITVLDFIFRSSGFNSPIGGWDVSSVTNMQQAFGLSAFNQPIGDWDVSSVEDMRTAFQSTAAFNQPIGDWNMSSVTTASRMINSATAFNQPIGDWDLSSATDISNILRNASSFNQNVGGWKLRRAGVDMTVALKDTALSPENYSRTLIGWANYVASSPGGPFDVPFGAGTLTYNDTVYEPGATYTNAVDARAYLTTATLDDGAGWTITDGGLA